MVAEIRAVLVPEALAFGLESLVFQLFDFVDKCAFFDQVLWHSLVAVPQTQFLFLAELGAQLQNEVVLRAPVLLLNIANQLLHCGEHLELFEVVVQLQTLRRAVLILPLQNQLLYLRVVRRNL